MFRQVQLNSKRLESEAAPILQNRIPFFSYAETVKATNAHLYGLLCPSNFTSSIQAS